MNSRFRAFLVLTCLFLFTVACASETGGAPLPVHTSTQVETLSVEPVQNGNLWYLPINKPGLPEANIEIIFLVVNDWQLEHPDLEIIDIDYLYMQNTYAISTSNFTYGVSLLVKQK